jgi:hypothetical protein
MKIILTESQYKELVEDYPISFSFETLLSIKSYNGRIKYCNENLKKIGRGSSRVAYKVDESIVLKVAFNQKGIHQNNAEIEKQRENLDILGKIFNISKDGIFLEMELAKKIKSNDFKRISGVDFNIFNQYLLYRYYQIKGIRTDPPNFSYEIYEKLDNDDLFSDTLDLCVSYNVLPTDLNRLEQWGYVIRDNNIETLIIIDYGFNNETSKYYK